MTNGQSERRKIGRTHLFAAVTLSWENGSKPARLRNLSSDGALVEMTDGPRAGETIKLRRSELSATGKVVWANGGKLGIHFVRPIRAEDWLPSNSRDQRNVDSTFQELKKSQQMTASPSGAHLPSSARSGEELAAIADMLDSLADSLSEDPHIVSRFLEKLQVLDLASQHLRRLSGVSRGEKQR